MSLSDDRQSSGPLAMAPLRGIRVLDLTRNVAGPFATMILGDMGADVVKIERPEHGDDTRQWGPPFHQGQSAVFLQLNRNKRSFELDLSAADSVRVMEKLVARSDVVVESFRPGALARLGFSFEWAKSINPRIVYSSISGFGHDGPLRDRPGYDPLLQAYAGLMSITGEERRPPVRVGFSVLDIGTGMWTAISILSALRQVQATGEGVETATSLFETALSWTMLPLSAFWIDGRIPTRYGSGTPTIVPYRAYATTDGHVLIATGNDRLFGRLCRALGHAEWATDPRFVSNPDRVSNREAIDELIGRAVSVMDNQTLMRCLDEAGIPGSPVRSLAEVATDEQALQLGIFREAPDDRGMPLVGLPFVADGQRAALRCRAPRLGEHTREILTEIGMLDGERA